ncbi:MAG: LysR family transcriptional regulator [Verrucomicrobiaceae bacterium]
MNDSLFSRDGLSLDRLRSFLAVAEAGSIARSAPDSLSKQAQVSRQIGELETFFGTELTMRRGKTLALSPAGERLAVLVRQQFDDLEGFLSDQRKLPKTFCMGAGASMLEWLVIPALTEVRHALKGASVRLEVMRSRDLVDAVRDGRLDFAVVREDALSEEQRIKTSLKLTSMSFHLCAARHLVRTSTKHGLADPQAWRSLPWAFLTGGGQFDEKVRGILAAACPGLKPAVECTSLLQVKELVIRGECVGILPSIGMQKLTEAGVVSREFEPLKGYGRPLVLHWNERQMRRREVGEPLIKKMAKGLVRS